MRVAAVTFAVNVGPTVTSGRVTLDPAAIVVIRVAFDTYVFAVEANPLLTDGLRAKLTEVTLYVIEADPFELNSLWLGDAVVIRTVTFSL